jgi:hypothetical protein
MGYGLHLSLMSFFDEKLMFRTTHRMRLPEAKRAPVNQCSQPSIASGLLTLSRHEPGPEFGRARTRIIMLARR